MKRTLSLLSAALFCLPVLCQESEPSGNIPVVGVVARLDGNPVIPLHKGSGYEFDAADFFSNSSIYTLIDGNIGDHFSYSIANHWLSTDPASLYVKYDEDERVGANLFYTDDVNWLDWANVTASIDGDWGGLGLTVGKDVTAIGSLEIDEYDFDIHYDLASYFWHEFNVYQWGATLRYYLPDEANSLAFQWQTSPLSYQIKDALWSYSLQWRGEYEHLTTNWSVNFFEYERGSFMNVIALGQEVYIGDFTIRFDFMNRATSLENFFGQEFQLCGGLNYAPSEKFDFFAKAGACAVFNDTYAFAGAGVHWFPLRDSRDLRVHGLVAYNNYMHTDALSVNLGLTYNLNLTDLFSKK